MSNDQPDTGETTQSGASPATGTSPLRLMILLLIFGVALAGLLYDYTVARPAIQKADTDIQGCLNGTSPDPNGDGTFSDDEVQSILQRKPSTIEDLENGKIEIYTWQSGVPFRPYRLYVVYSGRQLPLLHFASTSRPKEEYLPKKTVWTEAIDGEPMSPMAGEGEGEGRGRGGKKGKRKQADDDESNTEDPVKQDPAEEAPAKEEPAKEEPAKEEPAKEEPAKELSGDEQ